MSMPTSRVKVWALGETVQLLATIGADALSLQGAAADGQADAQDHNAGQQLGTGQSDCDLAAHQMRFGRRWPDSVQYRAITLLSPSLWIEVPDCPITHLIENHDEYFLCELFGQCD
jgi:hypothetical protein